MPAVAGAVAYYALLSIVPFLILTVIALSHLVTQAELLDTLESLNLGWGIVTNKRMRFTDPLVELLQLTPRTHCVVSGDTTAEAKPSPLPIEHACRLLNCRPERTLYVGDDRRDILAGHAAGCQTVAVSYGYLGDGGPLHTWGADLIIDHPAELAAYLNRCVGPK